MTHANKTATQTASTDVSNGGVQAGAWSWSRAAFAMMRSAVARALAVQVLTSMRSRGAGNAAQAGTFAGGRTTAREEGGMLSGEQAPLFVTPEDVPLAARIRLDHYTQLVRAELHLAINAGYSAVECAAHARSRVPYWTDAEIADFLVDRGADAQLRSYLWSYPAGIDWFVNLADSEDDNAITTVLHAIYQRPPTPRDLARLWPAGPPIGGPGAALRLRNASFS